MDVFQFFRRFITALLWLIALSPGMSYGQYTVNVNTTVMPPIPPYLGELSQQVSQHLAITLRSGFGATGPVRIKLMGTIERLSPAPISVSLRPDYALSQPIIVNPSSRSA